MPRHSVRSRKSHKKRSHRGAGVMDWLKNKALPFVKRHQLISRGVKWLGKTLNKPAVSTLGAAIGHTGYGRRRMVHRRRHHGGALRLAGGALRM